MLTQPTAAIPEIVYFIKMKTKRNQLFCRTNHLEDVLANQFSAWFKHQVGE